MENRLSCSLFVRLAAAGLLGTQRAPNLYRKEVPMKNPAEREQERRYQKAEEQYASERKDVPVPEECQPGSDKQIQQRELRARSSTVRRPDDTESPKPESKKIFSEAVSQFRPIDEEATTVRVGDSQVDGVDQTSPGVEDARGANRIRPHRDRKN
jgi:hypothetical protein